MLMQPVRDKIHHPVGQGIESTVTPRKNNQSSADRPESLKILADYLGLCPATVSVVLNSVPGRSIPQETRERARRSRAQVQLPAEPTGPVTPKTAYFYSRSAGSGPQ